jgi:putative redox protein
MNDSAVPMPVAADHSGNEIAPADHSQARHSARTRWIEGEKFLGETGSGHGLIMEGARGSNAGMRPMELFLLGLGGCTAVDVMFIMRGMNENVTGCDIDIDGDRAEHQPQVFTKIRINYILTGHNLSLIKAKLAIKMSRDRLCSASAMLGKTAEISHTLEIRAA